MEQGIYIKFDKYTLSKNSLITILTISSAFALISFFSNLYHFIADLSFYFSFFLCSIVAIFCLYHLTQEIKNSYIYMNDDEIWFKEKKQNETVLKFEKLAYFETRFSEIIFYTKNEERVILKLDNIADEKKRWEIKEFLKTHIKQVRAKEIATAY